MSIIKYVLHAYGCKFILNTVAFVLYVFTQSALISQTVLTFIIQLIRKPVSLAHQVGPLPVLQLASRLRVLVYELIWELPLLLSLVRFIIKTLLSLVLCLLIHLLLQLRLLVTFTFKLLWRPTSQIKVSQQTNTSVTLVLGLLIRFAIKLTVSFVTVIGLIWTPTSAVTLGLQIAQRYVVFLRHLSTKSISSLRAIFTFIIVLIQKLGSSVDLVELIIETSTVARSSISQLFTQREPSGKLLYQIYGYRATNVSSNHG